MLGYQTLKASNGHLWCFLNFLETMMAKHVKALTFMSLTVVRIRPGKVEIYFRADPRNGSLSSHSRQNWFGYTFTTNWKINEIYEKVNGIVILSSKDIPNSNPWLRHEEKPSMNKSLFIQFLDSIYLIMNIINFKGSS